MEVCAILVTISLLTVAASSAVHNIHTALGKHNKCRIAAITQILSAMQLCRSLMGFVNRTQRISNNWTCVWENVQIITMICSYCTKSPFHRTILKVVNTTFEGNTAKSGKGVQIAYHERYGTRCMIRRVELENYTFVKNTAYRGCITTFKTHLPILPIPTVHHNSWCN